MEAVEIDCGEHVRNIGSCNIEFCEKLHSASRDRIYPNFGVIATKYTDISCRSCYAAG